MSEVFLCSDLHIGHSNIFKFRKEMESEQHNREVIKHHWNKIVTKRDIVYVLGDAAFTEEAVDWIGTLRGTKYLVRGNHDTMPTTSYLRVFKDVYGLLKYKNLWLSHAPIHPVELRGKPCCHGHVHYYNVQVDGNDDIRYLNCCVENLMVNLGRPLICLREVQCYFKTGKYEKDIIIENRSFR